eukprot:1690704-Ditylum_brightwellii.AAC.1
MEKNIATFVPTCPQSHRSLVLTPVQGRKAITVAAVVAISKQLNSMLKLRVFSIIQLKPNTMEMETKDMPYASDSQNEEKNIWIKWKNTFTEILNGRAKHTPRRKDVDIVKHTS